MSKQVYVLQTRWLGDSEWENGIYVGATEEAAVAEALREENAAAAEDAAEDGEDFEPYESLSDVAESGEFFFACYPAEVAGSSSEADTDDFLEMAAIFHLEAESPSEADYHDLFRALIGRDTEALLALLDRFGLDATT